MSYEKLELPYAFDAAQDKALGLISLRAKQTVLDNYGYGLPRHEPIAGVLPYHGLKHTNNTAEDWNRLAEAANMTPAERRLGQTMAAAHDVKQNGERGEIERASAQWLVDQLEEAQFGEPETTVARVGLEVTEPIMAADGNFTGIQKAHTFEYAFPVLAKIATGLSTADMGRLHAPSSQVGACLLHEEVRGRDLSSMTTFQEKQVALIETYQYPHPLGEQVFGNLRGFVAQNAQQVYRRLEAGAYDDWNHLVTEAGRCASDYRSLPRSM